MVLVETIPDTLSLGKETRMLIQLSFFIFLVQLDKIRDGKGGLLYVMTVTHSLVRRIVTFAVYTLLVEMVHLKNNTDPISAIASEEEVSLSVFPFITLFVM